MANYTDIAETMTKVVKEANKALDQAESRSLTAEQLNVRYRYMLVTTLRAMNMVALHLCEREDANQQTIKETLEK